MRKVFPVSDSICDPASFVMRLEATRRNSCSASTQRPIHLVAPSISSALSPILDGNGEPFFTDGPFAETKESALGEGWR